MHKRAIALLLALALLSALLTGCGGGDSETDAETPAETADTADSADTGDTAKTPERTEPLTLTDEIRADPVAYVTDGAIHMGDTVMRVDGAEIPAGVLFYMLAYQYYQSSSMYANYGVTMDITQSADEAGTMTIADSMLALAEEDVQRHQLLRSHADALGLTLDEEQASQLEGLKAYLDEQVALFYISTVEDMLYANEASLLASRISDYYFGAGGVEEPTDETLNDYAEDHGHYTCRYILLRTDDLKEDDEAGRAAQLALAQDLYNQVKDLAGEELLTKFAELQAQYNGDGNTEPFSFDEDSSLVSGFREKVAELAHGEVGLTDETDYGYFVLLRLEPDLDEVRGDYVLEGYSALIEQWLSESSAEVLPALEQLDIIPCLNRMQAVQDAVLTEMAAEAEAAAEEPTEAE